MDPELPTSTDLALILPELWLVIGMCAVILVPFVNRNSLVLPTVTAIITITLALFWALPLERLTGDDDWMFHGMLTVDPFSQFFKVILLVFTLLVIVQWLLTSCRETDVRDVPDYLCLLLGATVGMSLMASANNLVMIFMAIEAASLPSFALAGFRKRHRLATEGSLKYVLFGAAASAIGVYGMSLVYGATGTLNLGGIADVAAQRFSPLLAVGLVAMFASIAFKLSAVPLHFWCPDVFEGAPIEVTTFLSVASKGAAVCLLVRLLESFSAAQGAPFVGLAIAVCVLGGITATWGNLVAFHQTNIKRLLAYSSIAHSGYMIMGAGLVTVVASGEPTQILSGAVLFYLTVYMFMNLGAFTIVALIAQRTGSEDIRDYADLISRSPAYAVLLTLFLLSLFGMPGLGGFMAKVFLGVAMFEVGHPAAFALVGVLLFNTLLSLYFYVRPVYFMVFAADDARRPSFTPRLAGLVLLLICAVALLWTGIIPQRLGQLTRDYGTLFVQPASTASSLAEASTVRP